MKLIEHFLDLSLPLTWMKYNTSLTNIYCLIISNLQFPSIYKCLLFIIHNKRLHYVWSTLILDRWYHCIQQTILFFSLVLRLTHTVITLQKTLFTPDSPIKYTKSKAHYVFEEMLVHFLQYLIHLILFPMILWVNAHLPLIGSEVTLI
jgi:hypothetical protein